MVNFAPMRLILLYVTLLFTPSLIGQFSDTLYIFKDTADIRGYNTSFCVFSSVDSFRLEAKAMNVEINESVSITIINKDTLEHTFTIPGVVTSGNNIAPDDTLTFNFSISQPGAFIYYSDKSYGKDLGASGQILVGYNQHQRFYWNLFEQNVALSHQLADTSVTALPTNLFAEVYTINHHSYPDVLNDTNAVVTGNVGDTIIISIVNSGKMAHSLHFHGYHVEILHQSLNPFMVGLIKDTFPVEPGATCVVRLVPHQPGIYPVHDHNLFAVNTGSYPGGMITHQNIAP